MSLGDIERVPLAAFEAQSQRFTLLLRWLIVAFGVSIVTLGFVIMTMTSYDEEVVTTTTSEITQDSDGDYGSNTYIGGDLYGEADDQDGYDNDGAPSEGSGDLTA